MKLLIPLKAKKEVKLNKSLQTLLIAATLIAIASLIATPILTRFLPTQFQVAILASIAIGTWLVVFLGGLFFSWLLKLTMQILGGKGEFVHGLATIAYSTLPISIGVLITALLIHIPFMGAVLSFLAIAVFGVIGYALVFRLIKLLFEVDMITAFVAVNILVGIIALAFYTTAITFGLGLSKLAPTLAPVI
ncbi:MAG: YIP1 family protein [Candidatus Aenigmarchaeota archaeon]|nr:YIP1 family protein [Candidatus Aenigmarchaeota archaeon]